MKILKISCDDSFECHKNTVLKYKNVVSISHGEQYHMCIEKLDYDVNGGIPETIHQIAQAKGLVNVYKKGKIYRPNIFIPEAKPF